MLKTIRKIMLKKNYAILLLIVLMLVFILYNIIKYSELNNVLEKFTNPSAKGLGKVDAVCFINLDKRTDRNKEIMEEMVKMSVPIDNIHRIAAVSIPKNGHKGCIQSHIIALRMAKMNKWDTVAILEDDAELSVQPSEFNDKLDTVFNELMLLPTWNVLILSTANKIINEKESITLKYLDKIEHATTSACYIVNNTYYDKLIKLFEHCNSMMSSNQWGTNNKHEPYALDQKWNELIKHDNWYAPKGEKDLIKQRNSFSTINAKGN